MHFITFAVVEWIDVFSRPIYQDIFIDSIRYCQQHRGLLLHAWCLMSNHTHLLATAKNKDMSDILRDFKKFTSNTIVKAVGDNVQESRRGWMLPVFKKAGLENSRNENHQFWRQDNHPIECFSNAFTTQKLNYIHNNPVKAGLVRLPEEYRLSSAKDYKIRKNCGLLEVDFI